MSGSGPVLITASAVDTELGPSRLTEYCSLNAGGKTARVSSSSHSSRTTHGNGSMEVRSTFHLAELRTKPCFGYSPRPPN